MTNPSPYLTDYWTDQDRLNFEDFAPALHAILRDAQTPLTVGVFGPWGSGKTSLMRMLRKKLDEPKNPKVRTVWFTAWKYDREDALWRAFILRVLDALYPREEGDGPLEERPRLTDITDPKQQAQVAMLERLEESVYRPVDWQELGRWTVDWLALLQQGASVGVELTTDMLPVPGVVKRLLKLVTEKTTAKGGEDSAVLSREVQQYRLEQLAYMEQFEDRFRDAIRLILGDEGRLVVFVDDLDRCLPEKAVEVLEAIKLFLEVEGTVFVLGMDRGVIGRGVETRYRALFHSHATERQEMPISGDAYLQKIVQIPFHLPPLAVDDMSHYIEELDKQIPGAEKLDDVTREVFARGVLPNPRQVKRALNIFRLLRAIARAREKGGRLPAGSIAWPLLAKTVLIQTQFPELYQEWRVRPTLVQTLEDEYRQHPSSEREIVRGRLAVKRGGEAGKDADGEATRTEEDARSGGLLDPYLNDRRKYALLEQMLAYPPPEEDGEGRAKARFSGLDLDQMAAYVRLAGAVSSDETAAGMEPPSDLMAELASGDAARMRDAAARLEEQENDSEGPLHQSLRQSLLQVVNDPQQPPPIRAGAGDGLALIGDPRPGVGLRDGLPDIDWVEIPEVDPKTGEREFIYQDGERHTEPTFWMARYPITNAQFQAFVDDPDGFHNLEWWQGLAVDEAHRAEPNEPRFSGLTRPRDNVSWYHAMAFCRWLTAQGKAQPALLPSGLGGRNDWRITLPTEWQWEKAVRGHDGREYPWGSEYISGDANVNETENDVGPYYLKQTSPVGVYPQRASPYGLMDMTGNVWEWCLNEYENPDRIQDGGDATRVVRGGSWILSSFNASARRRYGRYPDYWYYYLGFRVVCVFSVPISANSTL